MSRIGLKRSNLRINVDAYHRVNDRFHIAYKKLRKYYTSKKHRLSDIWLKLLDKGMDQTITNLIVADIQKYDNVTGLGGLVHRLKKPYSICASDICNGSPIELILDEIVRQKARWESIPRIPIELSFYFSLALPANPRVNESPAKFSKKLHNAKTITGIVESLLSRKSRETKSNIHVETIKDIKDDLEIFLKPSQDGGELRYKGKKVTFRSRRYVVLFDLLVKDKDEKDKSGRTTAIVKKKQLTVNVWGKGTQKKGSDIRTLVYEVNRYLKSVDFPIKLSHNKIEIEWRLKDLVDNVKCSFMPPR